jgi:hypothetical protein
VTASQVARAAAGACERVEGHRHFAVVGENVAYERLYGLFAAALGVPLTCVPRSEPDAIAAATVQRDRLAAAGRQTGYDPVDVARWQALPLCLDPAPAMEALGFGPDDLPDAVRDTVAATLAHGGQGPARFDDTASR